VEVTHEKTILLVSAALGVYLFRLLVRMLVYQSIGGGMNCPVCKTDITDPIKQYGTPPLCQFCYLAGESWVFDDPDVMSLLEQNYSLEDAMTIANARANAELERELNSPQTLSCQ
jgi:hypothetical protein